MKKVIGLALAASSLVALPSAANAQYYGHHRGYSNYGYSNYGYRHHRSGVRISVGYAPSYGYSYGYPSYGYAYPSYGYAYPSYGYSYPAYGYSYPAYNYGYNYQPAYYGRYGYNQCGDNTAAGAVVGGVAGALIGSSVADNGHYRYNRYGYRHYRGGDRTAGALIGGALGAVAGAAVGQGSCY